MFPKLRIGHSALLQILRITGMPPFPANERTIVEWGAIFNTGATFSNYVGYIRKVCFFLGESLAWDAAAVSNVIEALKLQGAGKYRSPNFIRSDFALRVLVRDSRGTILAQICYISFLFALRVPSEALQIRRAYMDDDLTSFDPVKDRALIALRGPPSCPKLVLRLARRKNLAHGCILPRPCFCEPSPSKAAKLCPVHAIWPAIAALVKPGASFPRLLRRKRQYDNQGCICKAQHPSREELFFARVPARSCTRTERKGKSAADRHGRGLLASPGLPRVCGHRARR